MGLDVVSGTASMEDGHHTAGPKTSWRWRNTLLENLTTEGCMIMGQLTKTDLWREVPDGAGRLILNTRNEELRVELSLMSSMGNLM